MILDGKTEVTAAPSGTPAGTAPTITINKIQSSYSINNMAKKTTEAASTLVVGATAATNGATIESQVGNKKFTLNNNAPAMNTFSQMRMPRAAAPCKFCLFEKIFMKQYF